MKRLTIIICLVLATACSSAETCPSTMFDCGGICADLLKDPGNCGGCGMICDQGHVCSSGVCTLSCQEGYMDCSGTCRDTMTDQYNCGTCGLSCAAGHVCVDGACTPDCPDGYTNCSGVCKNLTNDPANCGECANVCAAGEVCLTGTCSFTCPTPYTDCSGSCADLDTDHMNCGTCGNACLSGQICVAGSCENSCIAGLTLCSGACADLMRDPENCGSCASSCASGEVCYDGSCIAACPGGFTDCSGSCRDLDSDRMNCGACETECIDGEICDAGACVVTCASPLVSCPLDADGDTVMDSTICSNTSSDPENCGACGTVCALAEGCVSGSCVPVDATTTFRGFITWSQNVSTQSDAAQDALMDSTCASSYSGSRAATIEEITYGLIIGGPSTNTTTQYLVGKCPYCAGRTGWSGAVDGHCRNCVPPGDAWPTILPPHSAWEDYCCASTRSAICIGP